MVFEKTLTDIVKGIRSSKRDTSHYISQCIAEIKREMNSTDPHAKCNALSKLIFLQSMGYNMDYASFVTIEVISSPRFGHKRVGYLAASQAFTQHTDVVLLCTNTLKKELRGAVGPSNAGVYEAGLAIGCLSNIATVDLAAELLPDVTALTSHPRPYLRKKATLALFKLFVKYPKGLRPTFPKVSARLQDQDPSVVSCAVNVVTELSDKNPKNYKILAPSFYALLTSSSNNWMLIKVVKLLGSLVGEEPRLARKLLAPLSDIVRRTRAKSLLYEAVYTLTLCLPNVKVKQSSSQPSSSSTPQQQQQQQQQQQHPSVPPVVELCASTLRTFLVDTDQNLKYLGLVGLTSLLESSPRIMRDDPTLRDPVLACLSDEDITIRKRALGLLPGMVTNRNLSELVEGLLGHIDAASANDDRYRDDLALEIVGLCSSSRYALVGDFDWYVNVLVRLAHCRGGDGDGGPGDFVREEEDDNDCNNNGVGNDGNRNSDNNIANRGSITYGSWATVGSGGAGGSSNNNNNDVGAVLANQLLDVALRVPRARIHTVRKMAGLLLEDNDGIGGGTSGCGSGSGIGSVPSKVLGAAAFVVGEYSHLLVDTTTISSNNNNTKNGDGNSIIDGNDNSHFPKNIHGAVVRSLVGIVSHTVGGSASSRRPRRSGAFINAGGSATRVHAALKVLAAASSCPQTISNDLYLVDCLETIDDGLRVHATGFDTEAKKRAFIGRSLLVALGLLPDDIDIDIDGNDMRFPRGGVIPASSSLPSSSTSSACPSSPPSKKEIGESGGGGYATGDLLGLTTSMATTSITTHNDTSPSIDLLLDQGSEDSNLKVNHRRKGDKKVGDGTTMILGKSNINNNSIHHNNNNNNNKRNIEVTATKCRVASHMLRHLLLTPGGGMRPVASKERKRRIENVPSCLRQHRKPRKRSGVGRFPHILAATVEWSKGREGDNGGSSGNNRVFGMGAIDFVTRTRPLGSSPSSGTWGSGCRKGDLTAATSATVAGKGTTFTAMEHGMLPVSSRGADPFYLGVGGKGDNGGTRVGTAADAANSTSLPGSALGRFGTIQLRNDDNGGIDDESHLVSKFRRDEKKKKKNSKIKKKRENKDGSAATNGSGDLAIFFEGGVGNGKETQMYHSEDDDVKDNYNGIEGDSNNTNLKFEAKRRTLQSSRLVGFEGLAEVDLTTPLEDDDVLPRSKHRTVLPATNSTTATRRSSLNGTNSINEKKKRKEKKEEKRTRRKNKARVRGDKMDKEDGETADLLNIGVLAPIRESGTTNISDKNRVCNSQDDLCIGASCNPIDSVFDDLLALDSSTSVVQAPSMLEFPEYSNTAIISTNISDLGYAIADTVGKENDEGKKKMKERKKRKEKGKEVGKKRDEKREKKGKKKEKEKSRKDTTDPYSQKKEKIEVWQHSIIEQSLGTDSVSSASWTGISLIFRTHQLKGDSNQLPLATVALRIISRGSLSECIDITALRDVNLTLNSQASNKTAKTIVHFSQNHATMMIESSSVLGPFTSNADGTLPEICGTLCANGLPSVSVRLKLPSTLSLYPSLGLSYEDIMTELGSSNDEWSSYSTKIEKVHKGVDCVNPKRLIQSFLRAEEVDSTAGSDRNGMLASRSIDGRIKVRTLVKVTKNSTVKVDVKCTSMHLGKALISDIKRLVL